MHKLYSNSTKPEPSPIEVLRQHHASKAQFLRLASQFGYMHLATHGFFAPASAGELNPGLRSGLVFAGANQQRAKGILTALEIAALPLDAAELVTLSACQTGLGVSAGGEGLLGMQRAFQVSGARSTLASLWGVDDAATRRLMESFYRNLWKAKLPRLEALRKAQRSLRRSDNHAQPYYWAAFQLSGDWR